MFWHQERSQPSRSSPEVSRRDTVLGGLALAVLVGTGAHTRIRERPKPASTSVPTVEVRAEREVEGCRVVPLLTSEGPVDSSQIAVIQKEMTKSSVVILSARGEYRDQQSAAKPPDASEDRDNAVKQIATGLQGTLWVSHFPATHPVFSRMASGTEFATGALATGGALCVLTVLYKTSNAREGIPQVTEEDRQFFQALREGGFSAEDPRKPRVVLPSRRELLHPALLSAVAIGGMAGNVVSVLPKRDSRDTARSLAAAFESQEIRRKLASLRPGTKVSLVVDPDKWNAPSGLSAWLDHPEWADRLVAAFTPDQAATNFEFGIRSLLREKGAPSSVGITLA